jgi:hypothetical protein
MDFKGHLVVLTRVKWTICIQLDKVYMYTDFVGK